MFIISNILQAVAFVLESAITLYTIVIIVAALISWVNPDPYNPIVRVLRTLTEPVFRKVRQLLPFTYINGLDLSPLVVILALQFLNIALVHSLGELARRIY